MADLASRLREAPTGFDPRPAIPEQGRPSRAEVMIRLCKKAPPSPKQDFTKPPPAYYVPEEHVLARYREPASPSGEVRRQALSWKKPVWKRPWHKLPLRVRVKRAIKDYKARVKPRGNEQDPV